MSPSVFTAGNTALITGGASGVGLAVAKLCRKHGMKLALIDNNAEHLEMAKQMLGTDPETRTYTMDVGDLSQWSPLREKVKDNFGGVDFLMLNAGTSAIGGWENSSYFQKVSHSFPCGIILEELS